MSLGGLGAYAAVSGSGFAARHEPAEHPVRHGPDVAMGLPATTPTATRQAAPSEETTQVETNKQEVPR